MCSREQRLPPCTGRSSKLLLLKEGRGSRQHPQWGKVYFKPSPSLLNRRLLSPQTTSSQVLRTRLIKWHLARKKSTLLRASLFEIFPLCSRAESAETDTSSVSSSSWAHATPPLSPGNNRHDSCAK
ncbi:hypothetical protein MRX96_049112 [Rhipicephalus microplus]